MKRKKIEKSSKQQKINSFFTKKSAEKNEKTFVKNGSKEENIEAITLSSDEEKPEVKSDVKMEVDSAMKRPRETGDTPPQRAKRAVRVDVREALRAKAEVDQKSQDKKLSEIDNLFRESSSEIIRTQDLTQESQKVFDDTQEEENENGEKAADSDFDDDDFADILSAEVLSLNSKYEIALSKFSGRAV